MIRHVIAMQNDANRPHPFTGKRTVFFNADVSWPAAHPEWATKFKTATLARAAMRNLPAREGGYTVEKHAF